MEIIEEFAETDIAAGDLRYRAPLERDLTVLVARLPLASRVVLLGSIASDKYVDVLRPALGERLHYPLWFAGRAIFSALAESPHVPGRIYLDIGAREGRGALDDARRMRDALIEKGYAPGSELRWVEDPRGSHNEVDWGRRFGAALPFLVK